MLKTHGNIEYWSSNIANYIKTNGGHPDVSVGTMRFALQLWISSFLIFIISLGFGLLMGTALQTLLFLGVFGILRYFSGGWHLRNIDSCVLVTVSLAVSITLIPAISENVFYFTNVFSLLLVLWLAPTGHGQRFKSITQRKMFKWIAATMIVLSFVHINQIVSLSILCQSITLLTPKGGEKP